MAANGLVRPSIEVTYKASESSKKAEKGALYGKVNSINVDIGECFGKGR